MSSANFVGFLDILFLSVMLFLIVLSMTYMLSSNEPMLNQDLKSLYNCRISSNLDTGDIVFFSSGTKLDLKDHVLRLGGSSHFTHVGIIVKFCGIPYVFESVRKGTRLRIGFTLDKFLKKNKHNSIFLRKLLSKDSSKLDQLLHGSAKDLLNIDYSFDFMPAFYERVLTFLPLPSSMIQDESSLTQKKNGYSCLSLVKQVLTKYLKFDFNLLMNRYQSIDDHLSMNDELDAFDQRIHNLQDLFNIYPLKNKDHSFEYDEPLLYLPDQI